MGTATKLKTGLLKLDGSRRGIADADGLLAERGYAVVEGGAQ